MFLSFLGCDGSGKSAVIAGVTERLEKQGLPLRAAHARILQGAEDLLPFQP